MLINFFVHECVLLIGVVNLIISMAAWGLIDRCSGLYLDNEL